MVRRELLTKCELYAFPSQLTSWLLYPTSCGDYSSHAAFAARGLRHDRLRRTARRRPQLAGSQLTGLRFRWLGWQSAERQSGCIASCCHNPVESPSGGDSESKQLCRCALPLHDGSCGKTIINLLCRSSKEPKYMRRVRGPSIPVEGEHHSMVPASC